jgi:predicted Zn-dependent protease
MNMQRHSQNMLFVLAGLLFFWQLGFAFTPLQAEASSQSNFWTVLRPVARESRQQPVEISRHRGSVAYQGSSQSPNQILDQLMRANGLDPELVQVIRMQDARELNAYTDGQQIVITTALWNQLQNDDQRAFIVGHELSHIVLSHIERTQRRRVGLSLLDRFLIRNNVREGGLVHTVSNLGLGLIDKKFSRNLEYQADDLGMQLMTKAGYRSEAAINAFHVMQAANGRSALPEFLRTHPISESRIEALAEKYRIQR